MGIQVVAHTREHGLAHIHVEFLRGSKMVRLQWPSLTPLPREPQLSAREKKGVQSYVQKYGAEIPGMICQSCALNPMPTLRLPAISKILSAVNLLLVTVLPIRVQAFDIEFKKPLDIVLESMIGQMIMVGFSGYLVTDPGVIGVHDQLADGTIGGVVLYPENISPPDQLRALTSFLRDARCQNDCQDGVWSYQKRLEALLLHLFKLLRSLEDGHSRI